MVNYNNGKIYKIEPIIEHEIEEVYIGSTTKEYLCQRMDTHRSDYKRWKLGKRKHKTSSFLLFDKYKISNCEIILLESVNANSKDELLAREKYYIQLLQCVNKCTPNVTHEEKKEKKKEYNQKK